MYQIESQLEIQSSSEEPVQSFDGFGFNSDLRKCIKDYGIEKPSRIQPEAIQSILKRKDTIIQSPSGTGKTTAFVISLLHLLDYGNQDCQAIILVQSRELGINMQEYIRGLAHHTKPSVHCCVDSNNLLNDQKKLQEGVNIVIGSTIRILNLVETAYLKISNLKLFILDDADDLLSRGHQNEIDRILGILDSKTQIVVTSATIPQELKTLTEKYMNSPNIIYYQDEYPTLDNVKQFYILIDRAEWKFDTLVDLCEIMKKSGIVFCNKKKTALEVTSQLKDKIPNVSMIHYDMNQNERSQVLSDFQAITPSTLVTTDLFDQKPGKAVIAINYDFPLSKEIYLKRHGKTSGNDIGTVINFVLPNENKLMQDIEKFYNIKMDELPADVNDFIQ